jgi:hypothetical protein
MERSRKTMPATTRIVGIGVSFSATKKSPIAHLPLFAPFASVESLYVHSAPCIKKSTAIITQNREGSVRSALHPTARGVLQIKSFKSVDTIRGHTIFCQLSRWFENIKPAAGNT